jgi:hypothetical protein
MPTKAIFSLKQKCKEEKAKYEGVWRGESEIRRGKGEA